MKQISLLLLFFIIICSSKMSSQSFFIGGNGFYSGFTYSLNGEREFISGQSQIWTSPTIGFEFAANDKWNVGMKVDYIVLSEGLELFDGYYFDYTFGRLNTYLKYMISSSLDVRLGIPVGYVVEARQFNNYGSLDLIKERNIPIILFGAGLELGYSIPLSEKLEFQIHAGYSQFLNSLDSDLNQRLIPYSYVFNAQLHYHL